jgi:hypothetical protein
MNNLRIFYTSNIITGIIILSFQGYKVYINQMTVNKASIFVAFLFIAIGIFGRLNLKKA